MKRLNKIPESFYLQEDVIQVARSLIGMRLFTKTDGKLTGGIIAETEAYAGVHDKASHAYGGRKTARTEVMFRQGGIAYVYFSYGMHHLFNVVTATAGIPDAVLIRGIIPTDGTDLILKRRKQQNLSAVLVNGPAKLCQALGISLEQNTISLQSDILWIAQGINVLPSQIKSAQRVGVDYAGNDARLPYRFILQDERYRTAKK